jgi:hypothetical protein
MGDVGLNVKWILLLALLALCLISQPASASYARAVGASGYGYGLSGFEFGIPGWGWSYPLSGWGWAVPSIFSK